MTTINIIKIKTEILNFIRNSNIISKQLRGVETTTQTFTSTDQQVDFILENTGVKNIRNLTINGTEKQIFIDYEINIISNNVNDLQKITLFSPSNVGDVIEIEYDYSSSPGVGDRIYPDFNVDFIEGTSKFPRIAFDIVSSTSNNRSINDTLQQVNLVIDFGTYSHENDIEFLDRDLYNLIFNNKKGFNTLNLLRPSGRSQKTPREGAQDIFVKRFIFTAPSEFEKEQ